MKNLIKGAISYTVLVSVPIFCVSVMSIAAYAMGRDDGKADGMNFQEAVKADKENEE